MFKKRVGRKRPSMLRRVGRAIYRGAKKRYGTKGGMGRMVKDVAFVKSLVNAEKRRLDQVSSASALVGQVYGNVSGHATLDITPTPTEALTVAGRSGSSIKLHSSYLQLQFIQQSAAHSAVRGKIYIVQVKGAPQTSSNVATQYLNSNRWIYQQNTVDIFDYNSPLNPDYRGQYRLLRCKKFFIPADNYSSQTRIKDVIIPMKYNRGKGHHIRYNLDTTTVSDGQIVMFIVLDNGNSLGSNSTLTGIPNTLANTGLSWNYDFRHFYFDN